MRKTNSMQKIGQFAKQKGAFLLAEMSIVSIIASMGVAAALIQQKNALQTERYQAQGELLKTLSASLDSYIASNYIALTNNTNATNNAAGTVVSGSIYGPAGSSTTYSVDNIYAPTITELATAGFLSSGFSSTALVYDSTGTSKANYLIKISPTTDASNCPNCNLKGLAYLDKAVKADEIHNLGTSIAAIGANGLYSTSDTPETLYGRSGSTSITNPVSGTPAGILGASTDYSTSGLSNFMRIDGSVKPTGDQDWNSKNISKVGTFSTGTGTYDTTTSTWTGNGVQIDSNGDIHASGTIYGTLANLASTTSLDLFTTTSSVKTAENFVKAGAILVSDGSASPALGGTGSITASGNIATTSGNVYAGATTTVATTPSGTGASLKSDGTIYASGSVTGGSFFTTGTSGTSAFSTTNGNITSTNGNLYTGSVDTTSLTSPSGIGAALRSNGSIYASSTITSGGLIKGGGGLDANSVGVTNTGPITGATTITASGKITGGGGLDANSVGVTNTGPITGATTITASGGITGSSFTTTSANGGINTSGGVTGTSLYIGSTPASTNGTTTTGIGLGNTGTINVKNSDTATSTGTTIFNIINAASSALVSIKNFTDNITNAVLTVLGTIKASGGDLIATMASSTTGGNVKAASELQLTQMATTNAGTSTGASNAPTTFTTSNTNSAGGWFISADGYLTSLNGKPIYTSGDVRTTGDLYARGITATATVTANNVATPSGTVTTGSGGSSTGVTMSNTGTVTASSNITSSGGYVQTGTGGSGTGVTMSNTGTVAASSNITSSGGYVQTGTGGSGTGVTMSNTGTVAASSNITSSGGYVQTGTGGSGTGVTISNTGTIVASSTIQPGTGTATRNATCTTPGTIARDSSGILTCEKVNNGTSTLWRSPVITLDSNNPSTVTVASGTSSLIKDCGTGYVITGISTTSSGSVTQIRCAPIRQGDTTSAVYRL